MPALFHPFFLPFDERDGSGISRRSVSLVSTVTYLPSDATNLLLEPVVLDLDIRVFTEGSFSSSCRRLLFVSKFSFTELPKMTYACLLHGDRATTFI